MTWKYSDQGVKSVADKALVPLQGFTVGTGQENIFARLFLLLRDTYILSTLLFFLLRLDSYLFQMGMLPISPIILLVAWIGSIWILSVVSTYFEGQYALIFTRSLPIIIPFAAIVGFSWVGIFLEEAYFDQNYKAVLLPTLDFLLFLTGVAIGMMHISKWKWSTTVAIAFLVVIVTVFVDALYPGTFSKLDYRASGIYEQPNIAAFSMVLFLTVLLRWEKKALNWQDMILAVVCGVGIFFTFSRGGVVEFLLIALLYLINLKNKERVSFFIKGAGLLICLGGVIVFLLPDYLSQLEILQFKSARMEWFTGDVGGALSTSDARVRILDEYYPLIASSPLWGKGSGYVTSMWLGPHNIYVARWVENGIFGVLSYVWWLLAILFLNKKMKNFSGVAIVILLIAYGFISHHLLEERPILLLLSILTTRAVAGNVFAAEKKE
ncbi:MAG: conserved rane protein of unknown function [Firmicutes bacterium]|nr:conserved rane protein of unknown function [Bacillota bacterium]